LTPATIGNPDLKPERSEELEVGFDLALFEDRLAMSFTYYNRVTKDAILDQGLPTSSGFPGTKSVNAGEVKAWGTELQLDGAVLNGDRFSWDVGVTFSTMKNKVVDLGGLAFAGTGNRLHVEGYQLADLWWREVVSAEYTATGQITNAMCRASQDDYDTIVPCGQAQKVWYGHTYPQWELGVENTFGIGENLSISARVDAQGGHWGVNHDHLATAVSFSNTLHSVTRQTYPIYDAYRSLVGRDPMGFFRRDFAKLRTLSASYRLPERLSSRIGASRASITVAGDNLWTFWFPGKWIHLRNMEGDLHGPGNPKGGPEVTWDPEMEPAAEGFAGNFLSQLPPTRRFTTTLRLTF